ncbi:MAG TPA: hypothetical protein PKK10_06505 [Woeseiaceae bacterium]|nr:hypothetical protein [Woeseiaceae bacterium]
MAGAAGGYLELVGGEGRVRAGAVKMLSSDFLSQLLNTVNPFSKTDPYLQLRCTVVQASIEDGVLTGTPALAMQSDRLNVTAKVKVDLKTERIDVDINTVARKGLGLSLNDILNPYVNIKGTLAHPELAFDSQSALIQGGAAVATGGISILAKNFATRFLGASDLCDKVRVAAGEKFGALGKKYAEESVLDQ